MHWFSAEIPIIRWEPYFVCTFFTRNCTCRNLGPCPEGVILECTSQSGLNGVGVGVGWLFFTPVRGNRFVAGSLLSERADLFLLCRV